MGPNRVALCSYCGVQWFRSQLTRDASQNLACPDCAPGLDIVSLTEGNARLMRSQRPKTGAPADGNFDQFTSPPSPGFVDPNGPPPNTYSYPPLPVTPLWWVDGRSAMYSDTSGAVLAAPFAGRVRRVNFGLPAIGNAQAPSDQLRPYRENTDTNHQVGAGHYLNAVASADCSQASVTVAFGGTVRDKPEGSPQCLVCNGFRLKIMTFSANIPSINYSDTGGFWQPNPALQLPLGVPFTVVFRLTATSIKATLVVDGVRTDYSTNVAVAALNLPAANWFIGWDGTTAGDQRLHGTCGQALVIPQALSDRANDDLVNWLSGLPQQQRYCPPEVPLIVVAGDSIARGGALLYGVPLSQTWAMIAQQNIEATQPVNLVNVSVSGIGIAQMRDSVFPITGGLFYNAARARNVLIMPIGTNDIATSGHTGAVTLADYYAFARNVIAEGWEPVACTILNRNAGGFFNVEQPIFNTALRAGWAANGFVALADVQAIPQLANPLDLTYFSDGIHLTVTGQAIAEAVYEAAIQAALL